MKKQTRGYIFLILGILIVVSLAVWGGYFVDQSAEEIDSEDTQTETVGEGGATEAEEPAAERTVDLYYYNADKDTDENGNIMCSETGLVAVERSISEIQTPIQSTVELLLEGELTEAEKEEGLTANFPLAGFSLAGVDLQDGVATLEFNDPKRSSSGGSCRISILRAQIAQTAQQFEAVNEVKILPADILQP